MKLLSFKLYLVLMFLQVPKTEDLLRIWVSVPWWKEEHSNISSFCKFQYTGYENLHIGCWAPFAFSLSIASVSCDIYLCQLLQCLYSLLSNYETPQKTQDKSGKCMYLERWRGWKLILQFGLKKPCPWTVVFFSHVMLGMIQKLSSSDS